MSLLLCLATIVLWVRSYWAFESWTLYSEGLLRFQLTSYPGDIYAFWGRNSSDFHPESGWVHESLRAGPGPEIPIFGIERLDDGPTRGFLVHFTHWLSAILFAIAPTCWLLLSPRRRRANRRRLGLCPTCGYDLRATPERCPECGTEQRPEIRHRSLTSDL